MRVTKKMAKWRESGMTYVDIGRKLGRSAASVGKSFRDAKAQGLAPTDEPTGAVGRSIDEFENVFSSEKIVTDRINSGLEKLGDGWEYERDFTKLCGISQTELGRYREQFVDYQVKIPRDSKRIWAGTIEAANKMRKML
jgi:hypothetical protein